VKDFDAFLKKVQGLKLSRAYELMRLAGGRTTEAELKKDARERKRKSRANKKKLPKSEPKQPLLGGGDARRPRGRPATLRFAAPAPTSELSYQGLPNNQIKFESARGAGSGFPLIGAGARSRVEGAFASWQIRTRRQEAPPRRPTMLSTSMRRKMGRWWLRQYG